MACAGSHWPAGLRYKSRFRRNQAFDAPGGQAWLTDNGAKTDRDTPNVVFIANPATGARTTVNDASINDWFQTYLMYLPPGDHSRWVPLSRAQWAFSVSGKWDGNANTIVLTSTPGLTPGAFQRWTSEPEWMAETDGVNS